MAERPGAPPVVVASSHAKQEATPRRAHQTTDVDVAGVVWFAVALVIVIVAVALGTHFSLSIADRRPAPGTANRSPFARDRLPPAPRLQASPPADMAAFRTQENAILDSSGWIDQAGGVAHIPIEAAKKLLLERGLPVAAGAGEKKP
jgi:hypothetical protein